jgi:ceramide glucosyltransferase
MLPHARHDFLVIADADIRTNPDYLRRLAAGISEPAVGAVTCLYRALPRGGLAARLEALSVNTDFAGMVLLARRLERTRYAFGATIALRRQTLSEIGGLEAIANHLADDYEIGRRVADLGLTIAIDGEPVDTLVARESWPAVLHHQVRWARTQRVCRPAGYFFTILTNGTLWALLSPFVFSPAPLGLLAGTAVLTLRLGCAAILLERLRIGGLAANLVSLPAKDLLLAVVWLMAFTGNEVRWRGRRLRVRRNGEMIDVIPSLPDGLSEDGRGPAFEA